MNYELLWKMECEEHVKTFEKYSKHYAYAIRDKHKLEERIKELEDELESLINKHNADKLTGNVTIKCDTVNIYG